MASVVDICNLALSYLGDDATVSSIDPPEGSAQAEHCARFYPIARDSLLQYPGVAWGFATRTTTLAALSSNPTDWQYAYTAPTDLLTPIAILPRDAQGRSQSFSRERHPDGYDVIYADQEDATLEYVGRIEDPAWFPPLFIEALAWKLAAMIAGPLIKGAEGAKRAQECTVMSMQFLRQAAESDAKGRRVDKNHNVSWMTNRR